jgi:hypothetical protein
MASHPLPLLAARILLGCAALRVMSASPSFAVPTVTGIDPDQTSYNTPTITEAVVSGSNINTLGGHRCRWTHQADGTVWITNAGLTTSTSMACKLPQIPFDPDPPYPLSGPYDVAISDDGGLRYSATSATFVYECDAGTYGDTCSTCGCQFPEYCNDGWDGDGTCLGCPDGWWGPTCNAICLACLGQACEQYTGACICDAGYYSSDCSMECPGGAATPCSGNGTCDDGAAGSGTCTCADGFWGEACENTCPANCAGTPPTCDQATGECLACEPGFSGPQCQVPPVPALSAPLRGFLAAALLVAAGVHLRRSRSGATPA